jgi:hypothetical protein
MNTTMSEHAVTPTMPDAANEPDFEPTGRERLGIVAFVVIAVLATASWVVALVWGAVELFKQF